MRSPKSMLRITTIRQWIVLASLAFAAVLASLTVWRVIDNRRIVIERTEMIASGARDAAVASVRQLFQGLDLSLKGVQRGIWLLEGQKLDEPTTRALLFDSSVESDAYGSLYVIDKDGYAIFDLRGSDAVPPMRRFDKEPFRAHVDNPGLGLYIGRPATMPQQAELPVTRRLTTRSGEFFGVAAGHISMKMLRAVLTNRQIPGLNMSILFEDGTHLMRISSSGGRDDGHNVSSARTMKHLQTKPQDTFVEDGSSDGRPRVVSYARVEGYPLIVRAAVSADEALANWRSQSVFFVSIVASAILIQLSLAWLLWRQINLREEARKENATLAVEMAELAHTDQLTYLANRRGFDVSLDTECRRSAREKHPMAVLLVDVDHFKHVNDTLGHKSGDAALIDIADCLRACMRRAGDIAARFGGDEFAVILPNVDERGARMVAESIRHAVVEKDLRFGEDRLITISIGVGHTAGDRVDASALIDAADRALYRAKELGRNKVRSEPAGPLKVS